MIKTSKQNPESCPHGHLYYKSSVCSTYPECGQFKRPESGFLVTLSAPARRAIEAKEIFSVKDLSKYTKKEIMDLHGHWRGLTPKFVKSTKGCRT